MMLFLSLLLTCSSLISTVPEAVQTAFSERYGETITSEVAWVMQEETYIASFTDEDDRLNKVYFSARGEWLQSQARLYPSQLPDRVYDYYETHYFERDVTFLAEVTMSDQTIQYLIEWESYDAVHVEQLSIYGELLEVKRIPFTDLW